MIMAYFLITHARSGSSNLCVAISKILSETNPTWNLDEFFHPGNFQSWGDYRRLLFSNLDQGKVFGIKNLDNYTILDNIWDVNNINKNILEELNIEKSNLIEWKNQEIKKRLDFIDRLCLNNQPFVVKIFVDSDSWFNFNFPLNGSLILYRKKFTDSILSMMIKNYYYSTIISRHNFNGRDRYKGRDMSVPDFSFELSYDKFLIQTETFFRFLKFCDMNRNMKFVSYEELYYVNSSTEVFGKILNRNLLDHIDTKLKYSKEKKEYIKNIQQVNTWIVNRIKNENLKDICNLLNISYD